MALLTSGGPGTYNTFTHVPASPSPLLPPPPPPPPSIWRRLLFRHFDELLRADRDSRVDVAAARTGVPLEHLSSDDAAAHLRRAYVTQRKSLSRALFEMEARHMALSGVRSALRVVALGAIPWILLATMTQAINGSTESGLERKRSGGTMTASLWVQLALLFACHVLERMLDVHEVFAARVCSLRVVSALQALVFESAIVMALVADRPEKEGLADVVNLFERDAAIVGSVVANPHHAWSGVAMVSVEVYILLQVSQLDFAFMALAFVVIALALAVLAGASGYFTRGWEGRHSQLLNIVHECFKGIRMVKLNAWEVKMRDRIKVASDESAAMRRVQAVMSVLLVAPFMNVPHIFSAVVIGAMALESDGVFSPARVFTVLVLIHQMKNRVISTIRLYAVLQVSSKSFKKIDTLLRKHFMEQEQDDEHSSAKKALHHPDTVLAIENGCFKRGIGDTSLLLVSVNLSVQFGQLVVLCGHSGAGKSTLLRSMLDQTKPVNGRVFVKRGCKIAYCPQEPWLQTLSVKENILFGSKFNEQKYTCVLDACCLLADLAILPKGDSTQVGPNGVNLSGGQRSRIALARACYSDADVYLLDCPLASVDAIVQSDIFRKCILGLLRRKTIVFATHNPEIIRSRYVDRVVEVTDMSVVVRSAKTNGLSRRVSETESTAPWKPPRQVAKSAEERASSELALWTLDARSQRHVRSLPAKVSSDTQTSTLADSASYVAVRDYHWRREVVLNVALAAVAAMCGSILILAKDLWLLRWSSSTTSDWNPRSSFVMYAALVTAAIGFEAAGGMLTSVAFTHASSRYFHKMTQALLAAPMLFFYSTPLGEILQRYFVDMKAIDEPAAFVNYFILRSAAVTCVHIGMIGYFLGPAGVAVGALVVFELTMLFPFGLMTRLHQLMLSAESRKLNFISEALDGASTIRGFGPAQVERFRQESGVLHDVTTQNLLHALSFNCYVVIRSTCLFGVHLFLLGCILATHNLPPATLGLLLYYIINIEDDVMECATAFVNWLGYQSGVARVHAYVDLEEKESPGGALEPTLKVVPTEWPTRGEVVFDRVSFAYASTPKGLVALRDVSCAIAGGQKVGVVGRTGSGKSSVAMALFRLHPIVSGRILIDGVDTSALDVRTLRSSLSIIPEMPMFYRCSIRHYLDPFNEIVDDKLWSAIHKCGLHTNVSSLEQQLWDNAENWSVGERQALCLARALLQPSRVLILDEAFSAVDQTAAKKLLAIMASSFLDSTVFMISHRLDQMLQFDTIMVLGNGRLLEFGSMVELAADPHSALYEFLEATLLSD